MPIIKLQSEIGKRQGVFYQFNSEDHPIGEGGMGVVYKGVCINEHSGASRPVAIKFLYDDLPESAYERARREAEIRLRNDNLVEMLDFIEINEEAGIGIVKKRYHVVSELLVGVSLADVMQGKTKNFEGEDVPFAVKMLQDYKNDPEHFAQIVVMNILSGLIALHDAGYIHRDIDPSNIMLTEDGHIKIVDYGIAKQMNSLTTGDKSLTVAGKFMGKPEYAAPELVLGDIAHQNQTTDIYAVGILLYQCIVGHPPFEGAHHVILEKQLKAKLPLTPLKNHALKGIIATACEKKQELRYQTAAQMRVALENMNGSKRAVSNRQKLMIMGVLLAVALVFTAIFFLVKHKQESTKIEASQTVQQMKVEHQQQQQHQEMKNDVEAKIAEAESLMMKGLSREDEDHYEQFLMEAYQSYDDILKISQANPSIGLPVDSVTKKRQMIVEVLDSAKDELLAKADTLSTLDQKEMAEILKKRAEIIINFTNRE